MRIIQTVEGNLVWQNYDIPTNDEIAAVIEELEDELAESLSEKASYKEKYDKILSDNDKGIPHTTITKMQETLGIIQTKLNNSEKELKRITEEYNTLTERQTNTLQKMARAYISKETKDSIKVYSEKITALNDELYEKDKELKKLREERVILLDVLPLIIFV